LQKFAKENWHKLSPTCSVISILAATIKYYTNDAASWCKFLQHFNFILLQLLFSLPGMLDGSALLV